jgi:hypothetical protein
MADSKIAADSDLFNTLSQQRKFLLFTRRRFVIANSRLIPVRVGR